MRRVILAALMIVAMHGVSSAQNIRLNERIPAISTISMLGTQFEDIAEEYICLVFVHSESQPCVAAVEEFCKVSHVAKGRMAVVLITPELHDNNYDVLARFIDEQTSVAFDKNRQTFDAFGIEHVPYGVIYEKRRNKALWFGSIRLLTSEIINQIVK